MKKLDIQNAARANAVIVGNQMFLLADKLRQKIGLNTIYAIACFGFSLKLLSVQFEAAVLCAWMKESPAKVNLDFLC